MSLLDEYAQMTQQWLGARVSKLPMLTAVCKCGQDEFVMYEHYERSSTITLANGAPHGVTDGWEDLQPAHGVVVFVCAECGAEYRSDEVTPNSVEWD